jgi:predicted deacylase
MVRGAALTAPGSEMPSLDDPSLRPESIAIESPAPGPRLLVLGAVHGDERCGPEAIRRVSAEFADGRRRLVRGSVTLVPVTNVLAYRERRREGERNLNRGLAPTAVPVAYEDHLANWLCPLLAAHDVLVDLHSFRSPGRPFVMLGPQDNDGALEPFAHATREEALALRLGIDRIVEGWLQTYAAGAMRRERASSPERSTYRYGVGTTEYARSTGAYALTVECGQHEDPQAPEVAYRVIGNALAALRLVDAPVPDPVTAPEALNLCEVYDKVDAADAFTRPWRSFDPVAHGEVIGVRANGERILAPFDGWIVFPNASALGGREWFLLARRSERFDELAAAR